MKRLLIMIGLTVAILTGCQRQDVMSDIPMPTPVPVPEQEKDYALVDLALSLPVSPASTRQSNAVVQESGSSFRDINSLFLMPFFTQGKVGINDLPAYYEPGVIKRDFNTSWNDTEQRYRYYEKFYLKSGVASFLTYGWVTSAGEKAVNGSLLKKIGGQLASETNEAATPANTTFELEPVYNVQAAESTEEEPVIAIPGEAQAIADYLTYIANAGSGTATWANSTLQYLYDWFVNFEGTDMYAVLPGSAANVKAWVNQLKTAVSDANDVDIAIKTDILARIADSRKNACEVDYPRIYNLPDGAAVIQWSESDKAFKPMMQSTTTAAINSVDAYCYPAELCYFGNSTIKTSNSEVPHPDGGFTEDSWAEVVSSHFGSGEDMVTSNTKAVAIVKPMQYAVARMSAKVKAVTDTGTDEGNLKDSKGDDVPMKNGIYWSFPITGLMVSGQYPVRYDFTPASDGSSTEDERIVYDSQLNLSLSTTESDAFNTLLLQSIDGENVNVVLELQNNSGRDFEGLNGTVYAGTKFYLTGKVQLSQGNIDGVDEDAQKRIFTQDHTTEIGMVINSLANAYNVMPNIRSNRLEVSIKINLGWTQVTPGVIEFEE